MNFVFAVAALLVCVLHNVATVESATSTRNAGDSGQMELKTPLGMESLRSAHTKFQPHDVSDIRRRAQQNDAEALYFLGIMYYYGNAVGIEKDTKEAAKYFKQAANKGHQPAQVNLAMLLLLDPANNRNAALAVTYFTRAAENGDADAQWCLGRVYYEGRVGNRPDYERAAAWFHKSAEAGNPFGLFHMGIMHEYGLGVQQNFVEAGRFYKRAADMENLDAMYYLALLHAYGRGFPQDIHKASLLFKRAAESGHAPSQYYLGIIFLYGQGGFPRDYDMAFYWMDRAANGPSADTADAARRALAELRRIMSKNKERMQGLSKRFADGPRGGPEASEHLFLALDSDGDGRVSHDEFNVAWHKPPSAITFDSEDTNHDGFLSWDEFNGPNATEVVVANATAVVSSMVAAKQDVSNTTAQAASDTPDSDQPG